MFAVGRRPRWPLREQAYAQPTLAKLPQVGYVGNASPSLETALVEGFRLGLRERGYVEGKTIGIQYRWANGKIDASALRSLRS